MIPTMLAAARTLGKRAGRQKRPVTDCPYSTDGGDDQRAAARAWVGSYLQWSPGTPPPDFGDESDDE